MSHQTSTSAASAAIPVFSPTFEEFKDFSAFVEGIEAKFPGLPLCKVVPPKQWRARKTDYYQSIRHHPIHSPVRQHIQGSGGVYEVSNVVETDVMDVEAFIQSSEQMEQKRSKRERDMCNDQNFEALERAYWNNMNFAPPLYGAASPGSLFDHDVECWNVNQLHSVLDVMQNVAPGVTTSALYFGQWKSSFPWHVEDTNLHSINFLHFGQPKLWYTIEARHADRFERVAQTYFPQEARRCPQFLRHKRYWLSPELLADQGIPVRKVVHNPGEFVLTFPRAYHAGFNLGFNIAEATNFATQNWIEEGKRAQFCTCSPGVLRIDVAEFCKRLELIRSVEKEEDGSVNSSVIDLEDNDAKLPASDDGTKSYPVDRILDKRVGDGLTKGTKGKTYYLLRWKGCSADEDSWEPEENLSPDMIAQFSSSQSDSRDAYTRSKPGQVPVKRKKSEARGGVGKRKKHS